MALPEHVKRSIYSRYPTLSLLPSQSFGPLPLSKVGTSSPGAFGRLEQLMVEGRLGVLHHNFPVWKKHRIGQGRPLINHLTSSIFEFVTSYKCKCRGYHYELSVVRVEGGLVFLQRSEVKNGMRKLVGHDLGKHNASASA